MSHSDVPPLTKTSCGSRCTSPSHRSRSLYPMTSMASSGAWGIRAGASRARSPRWISRNLTACVSMACPMRRKISFWCAPRRFCTSALPVRTPRSPVPGVCGANTSENVNLPCYCTSLRLLASYFFHLGMGVRFMDTITAIQ